MRALYQPAASPWALTRGSTVEVLLDIPFRSEIMELPLVILTVGFSIGAMVVLGRWWEK